MQVMIADDSALFREGLAVLLERAGFTVTGLAGDGQTLARLVRAHPPEVAILDIRMPPTYTVEGLELAIRLRREHPSVAVLLLSNHVETYHAGELFGGIPHRTGYLLKDRVGAPAELADALHRVAAGQTVLDPAVVSQLVSRPREPGPLDRLSPREREVLTLVAEGRSNQGIADLLGLTQKTVEGYVRGTFGKLGLTDTAADNRRVLAVLRYLRG
ncbi:response regulator [Nonomuraea guangzhouensis]|uniref:Response regulator n=1 Tax=Nonomuraea guangzhouensis TaxID=1291555 RepID=A0ABW4G319_9ACTN|nr:response regulator transcription factor [Nonomuraea guangzhouensis]